MSCGDNVNASRFLVPPFYNVNVELPPGGEAGQVLVKSANGSPYAVDWANFDDFVGATGGDGASAYEVAVANGFVGSEAEWLASLVGADGLSAYEVAVANGFVGDEAAWLASLQGTDGINGINGIDGVNGLSAYEIAVANGFVGTEGEWLLTLVGDQGLSAYEVAVNNGFVGTEAEWLASLNGVDGLSAYEVAVANGFVGTEEEWLDSLKGVLENPEISIRVQADNSQTLTANTTTTVQYTTVNHVQGDITFDAGTDFITVTTGGRYHAQTSLLLQTPPIGIISNTALTLEVDEAADGNWVVIAQENIASTLASSSTTSVDAATDWDFPSGARVRTRITYNSTLGGVLALIFPVSANPVNSMALSKIGGTSIENAGRAAIYNNSGAGDVLSADTPASNPHPYYRYTGAAAINHTVDAASDMIIGSSVAVFQAGTGQVTLNPINGAVLNLPSNYLPSTRARYSTLTYIRVSATEFDVAGDFTEV